ncbi:MAG: hypothetical protein JW976_01530 [Syntrophaceae bacterium]|nr:hypothetical protein [Syntrophaceae bacterium]
MNTEWLDNFTKGEIVTDKSVFIYKMNPENYLRFTMIIRSEPDFFRKINSADRSALQGNLGFKDPLCRNGLEQLQMQLKLDTKLWLAKEIEFFRDYCRHYHQFFKELGAALKFNPLTGNKSGKMVRDKLEPMLQKYLSLIKPQAVFRKVDAIIRGDGLFLPAFDMSFHSKKLAGIFSVKDNQKRNNSSGDASASPSSPAKLKSFIIYLVTIGPGIDDMVKKLSREDEMFDAYVLNGIGGAAAEMVAYDLNLFFNDKLQPAKTLRYKRFSPGYGDWTLEDQVVIFKLLEPEKHVGVNLSEGRIMYPEKSTSGIMGLVKKEGAEDESINQ